MDSSLFSSAFFVLVFVVGVAELTGSTDNENDRRERRLRRSRSWAAASGVTSRTQRPVVSVDLSRTLVTDAGLKNVAAFTQLKKLDLHGTRITDAGLPHLQGLTQLQWLFLGQTEVTGAGMAHLQGLTHSSGYAFP